MKVKALIIDASGAVLLEKRSEFTRPEDLAELAKSAIDEARKKGLDLLDTSLRIDSIKENPPLKPVVTERDTSHIDPRKKKKK